mmetsp:Transcript_4255/g.12048  ORF Transcript_4255/g.12048 Transcript_4255/m.12048 type:complete len:322 (+) Transcript_4255:1116-2081(+)
MPLRSHHRHCHVVHKRQGLGSGLCHSNAFRAWAGFVHVQQWLTISQLRIGQNRGPECDGLGQWEFSAKKKTQPPQHEQLWFNAIVPKVAMELRIHLSQNRAEYVVATGQHCALRAGCGSPGECLLTYVRASFLFQDNGEHVAQTTFHYRAEEGEGISFIMFLTTQLVCSSNCHKITNRHQLIHTLPVTFSCLAWVTCLAPVKKDCLHTVTTFVALKELLFRIRPLYILPNFLHELFVRLNLLKRVVSVARKRIAELWVELSDIAFFPVECFQLCISTSRSNKFLFPSGFMTGHSQQPRPQQKPIGPYGCRTDHSFPHTADI